MTHFVQPEKIEIDANERAVNEKSPYCFFVCTTFDSFLNDLSIEGPQNQVSIGQIIETEDGKERVIAVDGQGSYVTEVLDQEGK